MIDEQSYKPGYPLNQFIDVIWLGKASNINLSVSHHAALFTELIFNYGDDFKVEGQHIENFTTKNGHQILSGLKIEPFQTKVAGAYMSIGLILKPFCYGILIEKFGTKAMQRISEILYELFFDTHNLNLIVAEQQLLQLFNKANIDSDLLKFEQYISSTVLEKGAFKDFNSSISISQKGFIQKFKRYYLLTPSEYVKLKRVNIAVQLLQNNPFRKLTDIGLEAGFYDQSHFIRSFKKFCGCTPKKFNEQLRR